MAFDPNDPEQVAAINAAKSTVTASLVAAHEAKVAELTGKIAAAETLASTTAAEYAAAKAAGESTAAELATLKAKADAAEARAAALETAESTRQAAADKAVVESLPEALRPLVAGKSGADLKAAAEVLNAHANKAVPGRGSADGGDVPTPTDADLKWAKDNGYSAASPAKIIEASARFGPRAEQAKREARSKQIATA